VITLETLPRAAQWAVLAAVSSLLTGLFEWLRLPAALLLGPLIGGILVQSRGAQLRVARLPIDIAQCFIGCLISASITASMLHAFAGHWALFLSTVLAVILASVVLGWGISRLRILQGSTAVWGLLPGAASVMMLMSEEFGADFRLVAFMQYLRVVMVAGLASVVARIWLHGTVHTAPAVAWFPPLDPRSLAVLAAIVIVALSVDRRLKLPAAPLVVSMMLATGLQLGGVIHLQLPPWLLAISYVTLGWMTGLRFSRDVLVNAATAAPKALACIALLLLMCCGLAWLLVATLHVDPLTAYLATSPGGADSIAIISASSPVDVPFVMAMQSARFLIVLATGPALSRFVARRLPPARAAVTGGSLRDAAGDRP
jgi:membrane AbrB-like protein